MKGLQKFIDIIDIDDINRVLITIEENRIYSSFVTDTDTAIGNVILYKNPFDDKNIRISISQLPILKKMLSLFKDPHVSIEYNKNNLNDKDPKLIKFAEGDIVSKFMLSYTNKMKVPKSMKDISFDLTFSFTEEQKKSYMKFSRILSSKHDYFTFETVDGNLTMLFGEHSTGKHIAYNSINYNLNVESEKSFNVKFDSKVFTNIIRKNLDADIKLSLEDTALKISCKGDEYKSIYYLRKFCN